MALSHKYARSPHRRVQLFLVSTLVVALLGAAGDSVGLEQIVKANPYKQRTYLFSRQRYTYYYELLHSVRDERANPPLKKFKSS